ncbi:pyroglutamyl-peptidase 1-like protein isoform 3-T3 [Morphnus guianensis]
MKIAGLVLISVHAKNENTTPLSVIKAKSYLKIPTSITKNTKIKNKYVCAYMLAPSQLLQSKHRLKVPFFSGFGPFRQYLVNSSWEAVKELSKRGLGKNIDLHIMQLPVVYQKAKEQVFKIWKTLQPLVYLRLYLLHFSVLQQWKSSLHSCASTIQIGKNNYGTEAREDNGT